MIEMNVPKYYPSKYKSKAEAVLDMLKGGETVKQIKNRMAVSDSYIYMIKKHMAEAPGEAVEADTDVDDILDERATTYGRFVDVAELAQELKATIRIGDTNRSEELPADQIEALEMIATKMARILCGDSDYVDSWIDITGYATLVTDRIQGKTR